MEIFSYNVLRQRCANVLGNIPGICCSNLICQRFHNFPSTLWKRCCNHILLAGIAFSCWPFKYMDHIYVWICVHVYMHTSTRWRTLLYILEVKMYQSESWQVKLLHEQTTTFKHDQWILNHWYLHWERVFRECIISQGPRNKHVIKT